MDVKSITFDGVNSWDDLQLLLSNAEIGYPKKNKSRIQIPNSNIYYDYADLFGDFYEERTLEFEFIIARPNAMTIAELEYKKSQIANWLEPGIRHRLSYSEIPFYYFLAEAQGDYDYTEENGYALLKVKFVCLPYKIHEVDESDDIWDTFEFENDIAQDLTFEVSGTREAKIYNAGTAKVSPKLIVTGNVTVELNGLSESLGAGTHEQTKIVLSRGWNKAKLAGSGTIRFSFSKEVL
ncbi:hypothetical protein [Ligilactobacillus murinus]|uniref:hypothetical protein n=1 Tax=Ligilactobacillus murinus TaxID=1622 RepID=UPI0035197E5C